MIVTFSGNDGSGKTTLIKKLKIELQKKSSLKIEVREEFNYFFLKYLFRIFGEVETKRLRKNYLNPDRKKKSLFFLAGPYLIYLDLFLEYIFLRFSLILNPRIVFLDRCIYDFYVSWQYLNLNTKAIDFLITIFPHYDLSFVVYTKPEIAKKRTAETHSYPLEFYERQTKRYFNLKSAVNTNLIYINNSEKIKDGVDKILNKFLENYWIMHEVSQENLSLFFYFLTQREFKRADPQLRGLYELSLFDLPTRNFPLNKEEFLILKRYYLKKRKRKQDIDLYMPRSKEKIIQKLKKIDKKYNLEPGRVSFIFDDTEFDVHTSLSCWGVEFISGLTATVKKKSFLERHLTLEKEILFNIAHSVYKHGLLSKEDTLAVLKLIREEVRNLAVEEMLKEVTKNQWELGFFYFLEHIKRFVTSDSVKSQWIPVYKAFYFWIVLFIKRKDVSLIPVGVFAFAYCRDRFDTFRLIFKYLDELLSLGKLKFKLGYCYEKTLKEEK